jgi:hypothetical protein
VLDRIGGVTSSDTEGEHERSRWKSRGRDRRLQGHRRRYRAGPGGRGRYASGKEGTDKVVAGIKADGGRAIAVKGDVGKSAEVQALFSEAQATEAARGVPPAIRSSARVASPVRLLNVTQGQRYDDET